MSVLVKINDDSDGEYHDLEDAGEAVQDGAGSTRSPQPALRAMHIPSSASSSSGRTKMSREEVQVREERRGIDGFDQAEDYRALRAREFESSAGAP
jgi:hypothetical protein